MGGKFVRRQLFIGAIPNGFGGGFIEDIGNVEVAEEFEVGPVIERVAQGERDGASPGLKLFVRACRAGDQLFRDAVSAHGTPLIMIAFEPDFIQVAKAAVAGDVLGREVAVVIEDGLVFRVGVKEVARGGGLEEEIVVYK